MRPRPQARAPDPPSLPMTGRIVGLLYGTSSGFVRAAEGQRVFFHRADVIKGLSFNGLDVGEAVVFDLVEDRFSGLRALRLRRDRP
jgi:hypothetical protein